jgi:hypothetical protein
MGLLNFLTVQVEGVLTLVSAVLLLLGNIL